MKAPKKAEVKKVEMAKKMNPFAESYRKKNEDAQNSRVLKKAMDSIPANLRRK